MQKSIAYHEEKNEHIKAFACSPAHVHASQMIPRDENPNERSQKNKKKKVERISQETISNL